MYRLSFDESDSLWPVHSESGAGAMDASCTAILYSQVGRGIQTIFDVEELNGRITDDEWKKFSELIAAAPPGVIPGTPASIKAKLEVEDKRESLVMRYNLLTACRFAFLSCSQPRLPTAAPVTPTSIAVGTGNPSTRFQPAKRPRHQHQEVNGPGGPPAVDVQYSIHGQMHMRSTRRNDGRCCRERNDLADIADVFLSTFLLRSPLLSAFRCVSAAP